MALSRLAAVGACGALSAGLLLSSGSPGRDSFRALQAGLVPNAASAEIPPPDANRPFRQAGSEDEGELSESALWLVPDPEPVGNSPLARAIKTLTDGDAARALPGLSEAADDPVLGPYALLYLGRAELVLERPEAAMSAARRILDSTPGGYVGEAALWLLADAAVRAERWADALAPLQALTELASTDVHRAHLRLAEAAEKTGDLSLARRSYEKVYYEFPLSDSAADAEKALGRFPAAATPEGLARDLDRAQQLYDGGRYADARRAFAALRGRTNGDTRALVDLRLAGCDVRLRQYAGARTSLQALLERSWARRAEVEYFYLSALRGLGREREYLARLDAFVAAHPADPLAERALDELGTHYILGDADGNAAEVFTRLYALSPRGTYADRAAWKAGWWAYRQRNDAEVIRLFTSAAIAIPRADYRPSWLYWAARAHERSGQPEAAAALYRQAVLDYRNSYYGRESAERLAQLVRTGTRAPVDTSAPARPLAIAPGTPPPNTPLIRSLLEAGLWDEAIFELRRVQRERGSAPILEATVAYALNRKGDLRPAITAMRRAYPQFMAEGGERLPERVLRIIFPIQHWDLLQRYAEQHDLDRYLLAAQVAQESTFQADVRSAANAYGLMQILPSTGRRFARQLGISGFTTARLTDPETNVRIGTHYLDWLIDHVGGIAPALAAYNAGERRVLQWQAERPGLEQDEFIDDIPYPETQFYVKRVLGTADDYRILYGGAPAAGRAGDVRQSRR